jgi:hypothetical protein
LQYNDVLAKEIHDLEAEVAAYSQAEGAENNDSQMRSDGNGDVL